MSRRGGCCIPSPWFLGFLPYLRPVNSRLGNPLQPPTFQNETPTTFKWFLLYLWCSWGLKPWFSFWEEEKFVLASWKSVSTSDLASLASCRTWEGKKIPIFIIISSYFMLWIPLKECYWSFGQRWNLRLVCDHLLALFDGKSVKSGSPLFHS